MNQESSIRESITLPKVDDQDVDPMVDLNVVDDGDAAILEDVGLVVASLEAVASNIINTTRANSTGRRHLQLCHKRFQPNLCTTHHLSLSHRSQERYITTLPRLSIRTIRYILLSLLPLPLQSLSHRNLGLLHRHP